LWKLCCHKKLYGHAVGGLNLESSTFQTTSCTMCKVAQGCFVEGKEHFDTLVRFEGPGWEQKSRKCWKNDFLKLKVENSETLHKLRVLSLIKLGSSTNGKFIFIWKWYSAKGDAWNSFEKFFTFY
jgi:hypothetical protein